MSLPTAKNESVGGKKRDEMVRVLRENWREELIVARTYRALADAEPSVRRRELLIRMAVSEEEHAALWEQRLAALGESVDPTQIEQDVRKQHRFIRLFGSDAMIRRIEREERGHVADYQAQIAALNDPESTRILQQVIPDEQAHAERLQEMAAEAKGGPRSRLDSLLSQEKWHAHGTGSWIGDAIYGINDGLGAVFGIVSAVAGATDAQPGFVLIAGLAGMIGSAFSMGSSAYLAAKSEREVHEAEIERERREIEEDPEHEREELELMYQIKGFSEEEAKTMAARLTASPEEFLKTMAGEELGLSEDRLPNPWMSAVVATVSTAIGAFLPIVPFFYTKGMEAVLQSLVISIVAHFAVGASKTFITGRSWVKQGLEMTFVGILGGALAYGFGLLLGAHGSF
ncbi:MAG: VIT1/CCC1 transporter family protein [Capsulimonadales bacterium]|nr:VIT1/CCC1 transporter family protein [Capsulimonadales bacterium]